MAVKVRIPTPLRKLTRDQEEVEAKGGTVKAMIDDLEANYPGLKTRLCDDAGAVRRFVNIYVNQEDIRQLKSIETALKDGDKIAIVPAIAGG
ncbi:MAG: MoaD/ThiS family protein [Myxococcales bacterium]|nr:MoaD/ThiS family protein [Myxococcales bacterium]